MYFCYWGGILQQRHEWQNPSSTKLVLTRHYAEAKRVNTDVLAWEALLLPAVSTGVWLVNASAPSLPASSAVATLNAVKSDQGPSGNFVLGQFTIPGTTILPYAYKLIAKITDTAGQWHMLLLQFL